MKDDENVTVDCKVVAFDCDGVMFDSVKANTDVCARILEISTQKPDESNARANP